MARFDTLTAWLDWQEKSHPRLVDLGLDRATEVYRKLGCNLKKPLTITVGGTNGKGSCVALLAAIYQAQGYKVGAYTSPHILRYNERICINGEPVSDDDICQAFAKIDQHRADVSLSYFEFGTLAALDIFAEAEVDIQLLEVGLGGRLDAVNIIDADVAIITTVAIDHVDWLGATLEAIGKEKAGIFRSGVPAIIGDECPPDSVIASARQKNACLLQFGQAFHYQKQADGWQWWSEQSCLSDLPPPAFSGEHQFRNAATVLMGVEQLQNRLPVSISAIVTGLSQAKLSGRFQLIANDIPVLLDVGHNPQAVQTIESYLLETFPSNKVHAVFAMMKDKDIDTVIALMHKHIHAWYLAPLSSPRAASPDMIFGYFQRQGIDNVHVGFNDFTAAFMAARHNARPGELILIFGSFFLVSEYLAKFTERT